MNSPALAAHELAKLEKLHVWSEDADLSNGCYDAVDVENLVIRLVGDIAERDALFDWLLGEDIPYYWRGALREKLAVLKAKR